MSEAAFEWYGVIKQREKEIKLRDIYVCILSSTWNFKQAACAETKNILTIKKWDKSALKYSKTTALLTNAFQKDAFLIKLSIIHEHS